MRKVDLQSFFISKISTNMYDKIRDLAIPLDLVHVFLNHAENFFRKDSKLVCLCSLLTYEFQNNQRAQATT